MPRRAGIPGAAGLLCCSCSTEKAPLTGFPVQRGFCFGVGRQPVMVKLRLMFWVV